MSGPTLLVSNQMIGTDTYPDLDEAHIDALFAASRQAVADAYAAVAAIAANSSVQDIAIFRSLPRKYLPRYTYEFAQRFAATVTTVAWKLTEPNHVCSLACTAEDVALKCILDLAKTRLADDEQYEELAGAMFDDDAFLVLWDQARDGVEERYPGTANLAFADWFEPFGDAEQVHPFLQEDSQAFRLLWANVEPLEDDLEDPTTEVFIALGEDWLDVPDQVSDRIPAIIEETRALLFPDRPARSLSGRERERVFESAAEDLRLLVEASREDSGTAYDVWLLKEQAPGRPKMRRRLQAGLPLEEALNLRKLERMGEYRGVTDIELRVYPADHDFEAGAAHR